MNVGMKKQIEDFYQRAKDKELVSKASLFLSWMKKNGRKIGNKLSWLNPKNYISILDWYIIKKFIGTYIFSIVLIISIAIVFDFNENLSKFTQYHAPMRAIIFDFYANFIPYYSNLFSPLFVFIAVIFLSLIHI